MGHYFLDKETSFKAVVAQLVTDVANLTADTVPTKEDDVPDVQSEANPKRDGHEIPTKDEAGDCQDTNALPLGTTGGTKSEFALSMEARGVREEARELLIPLFLLQDRQDKQTVVTMLENYVAR